MSRCLHITINESSGAAPRAGAASVPGWAGTDPGSPNVMPLPEDPGSPNVMPLPEDPGSPNVMPLPEDPDYPPPSSGGYGSSGGSGGSDAHGAVVSVARSCGCAAPACSSGSSPYGGANGVTALRPGVRPRDFSGFVIVRMAPGIEHPTANSLWKLARKLGLTGLRAALQLPGGTGAPRHLTSRPLIELQRDTVPPGNLLPRSDCLLVIGAMEAATALTAFPPLHSLKSYWRLDLREHPGRVASVVARLNGLAEVDLAYRELTAADSGAVANGQKLADDQGYLDDAPAGISASWAWASLGSISPSLNVCDLEQGWNVSHQDLGQVTAPPVYGVNRADEGGSPDHGTAVLGELAAASPSTSTSTLAVKGAAAGFGQFILASHYRSRTETGPFAGTNGHVAAAIVQALPKVGTQFPGALVAGDVLLLEVQRGLLPTEVDEADCDAIRLASGLGVIVIEAAGNGGFNLDASTDPDTHRSLRRGDSGFRDSGAVLVGAARASLPHDREPFSNYGSRLDCYGWGETVTTCGFGDLSGTSAVNAYTNTFSGTSSASPIVAGAAVLLQSLYNARTSEKLDPRAMRDLLSDPATGTPQGPNVPGRIGVMPDLRAIVRNALQLVPDVYIRHSVCDDGSALAPSDEISSSPDVFVWPHDISHTRDRWGEERRRGNAPAPGVPVTENQPNNLYVRLRNRGLGEGGVHVQLFASPAATLITPESWIPVDSLDVQLPGGVPQGDTLFVAGPVVWTPPSPSQTPPPPWSFLAVLTRPGDGPAGLPPGPPYFEWAEYRTFLRQPWVAWRNTHRVSATNPVLNFCITGTPDLAHVFDFEVIQHLPAGAQVNLQVPPGLAAKLRQRQPLLRGNGDVPARPRTPIKGVQLAAGACAAAVFTVHPNTGSPLAIGHSLALRQLWRGEEVGRITWYFDPNL
jgi:hypothetical protein